MILQTNSYIVPKEKRAAHARLLARFRQSLAKLGCDHFEAYEQVGANWSGADTTGRFVQIMRFRDRKHQQQVQAAERVDPTAQALIKEFCELINFPYQQQQGLFAVGFYNSILATAPGRAVDMAGAAHSEANIESAAPAEVDPSSAEAPTDTESNDDPPMIDDSARSVPGGFLDMQPQPPAQQPEPAEESEAAPDHSGRLS